MGFFFKGPDGEYDDSIAQDIILNGDKKVQRITENLDLQSYVVLLETFGPALERDRKKIQGRMDAEFPGAREKINKERAKNGLPPI